MNTGAITGYFDVAQIVLYVFWIFFAGLLIYLHREDKREGYPLESTTASGRYPIQGFPAVPKPKTYKLADGSTVQLPRPERDTREIHAKQASPALGSPMIPTGIPLLDAVGPGAYALRADHPDVMLDGTPLIQPLRKTPESSVASEDANPIGYEVIGADRVVGGVITDIWVDRAEPQIRYLELKTSGSGKTVLLPVYFSKFEPTSKRVTVRAILGAQFEYVPQLRNPDVITMLEEEKVTAFYGGGTLYATPARSEPFI
jgi:photosynthetic reaction center H subunit